MENMKTENRQKLMSILSEFIGLLLFIFSDKKLDHK